MLYQLNYEATHWEQGQFIEFIEVNSAMLYQLSYEATHWEQGQFIEFIWTQ